MPVYEYKVVPAPDRGIKSKGLKAPEARFAHGLETLMNEMASDGWEYQRAETLPSVERAGLTGSTTEWRNLLVFRRLRENDADEFAPELLPTPSRTQPPQRAPDVPAEPPLTFARESPPQATTPRPVSEPTADTPPSDIKTSDKTPSKKTPLTTTAAANAEPDAPETARKDAPSTP